MSVLGITYSSPDTERAEVAHVSSVVDALATDVAAATFDWSDRPAFDAFVKEVRDWGNGLAFYAYWTGSTKEQADRYLVRADAWRTQFEAAGGAAAGPRELPAKEPDVLGDDLKWIAVVLIAALGVFVFIKTR
jgi:hypothetical protein